jgi:hypothetical protein
VTCGTKAVLWLGNADGRRAGGRRAGAPPRTPTGALPWTRRGYASWISAKGLCPLELLPNDVVCPFEAFIAMRRGGIFFFGRRRKGKGRGRMSGAPPRDPAEAPPLTFAKGLALMDSYQRDVVPWDSLIALRRRGDFFVWRVQGQSGREAAGEAGATPRTLPKRKGPLETVDILKV